ncbi:MAG: hypothetical protein HYY17_13500 [Planctomycetes bacterium]|nr:hypothetical protein [Planctomycetota bacterium]
MSLCIRLLLPAFLFLFPAVRSDGDEVALKDGRKLVGRVVEEGDAAVAILTYKEGPISVPLCDVKGVVKKPSLYDAYDKKKTDFEDSADGHFKLGQWCKEQGLLWQAREEWKVAVGIDPAHEAAHKALGDERRKGEWVSFEQIQKEKGLELFEGRWLKPAEIERIKFARRPYYGWVLTATYKDDADRAFLDQWGERAKEASAFMWKLTEGQVYVKEITVTDKGGKADFTIVNKDAIKIGGGAYAATGADTITAPGKILAYTFFHELIHFKYKFPHCENCRRCIMSSDPYANTVCDDADHKKPPDVSCWSTIRKYHKDLALRPLARDPKVELPPVPETKVIVKDR